MRSWEWLRRRVLTPLKLQRKMRGIDASIPHFLRLDLGVAMPSARSGAQLERYRTIRQGVLGLAHAT